MTKNDKRKFELNKSSEHDFDISKGSKRKFDLIKDEDNVVSTTTSSSKAEKAIETQVSEESNGSKKWIIWALIIVILALLAWWIFSGDNNSSDEQVSPETTELPQEISADSVATAEDNVDDVTISDADAVPSEEEPGTDSKTAGQNSNQEQASASVADTPSNVTPNSSVTVSDDIEAEAMKVIRGDYGNNPNRKNVLGARYHDIQARVNQLMNK
jgi:cytoskeletal protein RodZ